MILGGGPNRIGQGIEFDYCCCHAAFALREAGFETIMVNCNPETVSTDYDTSDRLFFEPLTAEDVLEIIHVEQSKPAQGRDRAVRRPDAAEAGAARWRTPACRSSAPRPTPSTSPRTASASALIEQARPQAARQRHRPQPGRGARASPTSSATRSWCGRPTCWAAGPWRSSPTSRARPLRRRASRHARPALRARRLGAAAAPDRPFLRDAIEVDVDCLCDGTDTIVGGVMEHIEEAGIHSGDCACSLPAPLARAIDHGAASRRRPATWPSRSTSSA